MPLSLQMTEKYIIQLPKWACSGMFISLSTKPDTKEELNNLNTANVKNALRLLAQCAANRQMNFQQYPAIPFTDQCEGEKTSTSPIFDTFSNEKWSNTIEALKIGPNSFKGTWT